MLDNLVKSLNDFKDDIVQLKQDNTKLNEDIQALEKEKDLGYKSFNTETHMLVSKVVLNELRENFDEARSSASYASDEASSARSSAEDAEGSADSAEEFARYCIDKIDELIREAEKEDKQDGEVQS